MIDTDTRQIRRLNTGDYISGGGKRICDHCGFVKVCPMSGEARACPKFLPTIPFTDEAGMRKLFNTVRVGVAWHSRLDPDQKIALYNSKEKRVFGFATVLNTFVGHIDDVLRRHAHANHLMLSEHPEEAEIILGRWMKQNYGPHIIHENTRITAIYLLREHIAPVAPSFSRDEKDRLT